MPGKKWTFALHDQQIADSFERLEGVSPVTAKLLSLRGVERSEDAVRFLQARLSDLRPPAQLPGASLAAELLFDAIRQDQKIAVYGDYDADGMTATAILCRCFQLLGADHFYHVPNRLDDGYGLNLKAIDQISQRGAKVIVTVDCGIGSHAEIDRARQLGMSVIVSDHHLPPEELPPADAIVHPGLEDYPFPGLCGAGVALKIAWALGQRVNGGNKVSDSFREFLMSALGLAALGTVADVVPLLDENRTMVRHGLIQLKQTRNEGLRQLMKITELDKKPQLSSEDIAFCLGPRLNAAGRLGQAPLAVELLTSDSVSRVHSLAEYIDKLNSSRDSIERRILKAAQRQIKDHFDPESESALVLSEDEWHKGVIGIVAGRLAEKYHRPTLVISSEIDGRPSTGSGRTAMGIDLYQALSHCSDWLLGFGGHAAAAGFTIDREKIDEFRVAFCDAVSKQENIVEHEPELRIDVEVALAQLTLSTLYEIEKLAPFGQQNPRPILSASGVRLSAKPKKIGEGGRHLAVQLAQHEIGIRGVAFGCGEWADELEQVEGEIDVAFRPVINEFRGRRSVEVQLVDWRKSACAAEVAQAS